MEGKQSVDVAGKPTSLTYMPRKIWVCATGVDGAGKTTAAQYMTARFAPRARYWKSPHSDWVRMLINLFGDDTQGKDVWSDALTFATAHREEQYRMREWWKNNDVLVSQRG